MSFVGIAYFSSCHQHTGIEEPQFTDVASREMPGEGDDYQRWIVDGNTDDWGWGPCPQHDATFATIQWQWSRIVLLPGPQRTVSATKCGME